jgi:tetratricopeptide (TPR) repeat protein
MLTRAFRRLFKRDREAHACDLQEAFRYFEAGEIEKCERIVERHFGDDKDGPVCLNLRGLIALARGSHRRARSYFTAAANASPEVALYQFNLGNACLAAGDMATAIGAFERASALKPDYVGAWKNLGLACHQCGQYARAAHALEHAFGLDPSDENCLAWAATLIEDSSRGGNTPSLLLAGELLRGRAWVGNLRLQAGALLARVSEAQGLLSEAADHYRVLISLQPNFPGYHNNLARCLTKLGHASEAALHYFKTYRLAPDFPDAYSSLLSCLNYGPVDSIGSYQDAIRGWEHAIASRFYPRHPVFDNERSPDRRLRIGYLSPDLRQHVVGKLFLPVLARHDRSHVFVACYHVEPRIDSLSREIARNSDLWRHLAGASDEDIAARIRADRIDILVDLSGHTAYARPLVFARKPAPVQVSWLGYFNTTGLATMDWFITDVHSSGPGQDRYFSERLYRLPETRMCYEPYPHMGDVGEPPVSRSGRPTFGCLNNLAKINSDVLRTWSRILAAVPGSRLLIQSSALKDAPNRKWFIDSCLEHGISADRLDARAGLPLEEFSKTYAEIDIALDPFPFCGGVTSFDALWMGVPVVTLEQEQLAGRQTLLMLENLGLGDFVAHTVEEYVTTTVLLANDRPRLEGLRRQLRGRFMESPLMDYSQLAGELEKAYRSFWQTWLSGQ